MFHFMGGPADGKALDLERAPLWLRVVVGPAGELDALDQLDDQPAAEETIHVYRCTYSSRGIACSPGRGCRPFISARYVYHEVQPSEGTLRDRAAWKAWAEAQPTDWPDNN